jgi:hypothetical protein
MKCTRIISLITLSLLLTACLTNSSRLVFGPDHFGKNKLIQGDELEQDISLSLNEEVVEKKDREVIREVELDEQLSHQDSTGKSKHAILERLIDADSTQLIKRAVDIHKIVENGLVNKPSNSYSTKKEPKTDGELFLKILLIIFIVVLVLILLGILLFYLFVNALNEAGSNGCYIATMTYGSYDHPKVKTLRTFRDEYLAKRKWGMKFIQFYYKYSPSLVQKLQHHRRINSFIRANLNVFVFILRKFYP